MAKWTPSLLSLLRMVSGFLFLMHGMQKLFGFPAPIPAFAAGLPPLMLAAGIIELVGGIFLLAGLVTRPVAFVLSGEMAAAYFNAHFPQGFWPLLNGGELAVLYCFLFLFIAAAGPGPVSLDALLGPRATSVQAAPRPRHGFAAREASARG